MSDDSIRRSDALKVLSLYGWTPIDGLYDTFAHDIPSADRPQGEWEAQVDADGLHVICSVCGQDSDFSPYYKAYKYCPHCGAQMKGADDEM